MIAVRAGIRNFGGSRTGKCVLDSDAEPDVEGHDGLSPRRRIAVRHDGKTDLEARRIPAILTIWTANLRRRELDESRRTVSPSLQQGRTV